MPATTTTTEQPERVRVSAYQARIERSLTDHYYEVPETRQAGREWVLTHVAHTNGYASCELCGHTPIKRLFFIRNSQGRELMIGSECARNYADVDLVNAYLRRMTRDQGRVREAQRRAERLRERQERYHQDAERRRTEFAEREAANADVLSWLRGFNDSDLLATPPSDFVASVARQLGERGWLSDRQLEVAARLMREQESQPTPPRSQNALDRAARADDCPNIYNGTYTVTDLTTNEHMTFQIYTPQRGRLQGVRIVKVMRQYSRYEGFAFVGRDGELVLWRRFRDHANQPYVLWATRLLGRLRDDRRPYDDTLVFDMGGPEPWRVERTRSCRRCNRLLTTPTSIHAGIGPECQRRTEEETTAAQQRTADAPTVQEPVFGTRVRTYPREDRPARAAPAPVVEQQPLLSELGSGELL